MPYARGLRAMARAVTKMTGMSANFLSAANMGGQFEAIHARHFNIGYHQVERISVRRAVNAIHAVHCRFDRVASGLQNAFEQAFVDG